MPDTAIPKAIAERIIGGRPPRPAASQSASPEAPTATPMLAATLAGAWTMWALACNAAMPM